MLQEVNNIKQLVSYNLYKAIQAFLTINTKKPTNKLR